MTHYFGTVLSWNEVMHWLHLIFVHCLSCMKLQLKNFSDNLQIRYVRVRQGFLSLELHELCVRREYFVAWKVKSWLRTLLHQSGVWFRVHIMHDTFMYAWKITVSGMFSQTNCINTWVRSWQREFLSHRNLEEKPQADTNITLIVPSAMTHTEASKSHYSK